MKIDASMFLQKLIDINLSFFTQTVTIRKEGDKVKKKKYFIGDLIYSRGRRGFQLVFQWEFVLI